MHYVYSTMTAAVLYGAWKEGGGDMPTREASVLINGGANAVDKKTLITPRGVVTEVTDEQLAILEGDSVFQIHKENGFISVESTKAADADNVAALMEGRDESAPLVEADVPNTKVTANVAPEAEEAPKPTTTRRR